MTEVTVGTALTKRIRGRPNPKDLGLLRNKIYRQPTTVIKKIMKLSAVTNINEPNEQKDWDDIEDIEVPNYTGINELVHSLSLCFDKKVEYTNFYVRVMNKTLLD